MKKIFTWVALAILTAVSGCCCNKNQETVTMEKASVLLDVRTPQEFQAGAIPGAINLPLDSIVEKINSVVPDKSTPIYLYCRSGRRSAQAKDLLQKQGYQTIHDLGGINQAREKLNK